MIKEVRKEDGKTADYIRYLIRFGKINAYFTQDKFKYLCYDTKEVEEYKRNVRIGRPAKKRLAKEN